MMEAVRLRVLFKDKELLTEFLSGLSRSWIVLKPHLRTISDLSSYILSVFHLHDACPNGLILSMDGFVLPPFESVCILKDKDIVRVKKKKSKAISLSVGLIETEEFRERKPVDKGVKLLDKEFDNESNGYESESEEDEPKATLPVEAAPVEKKVSKKRKASKIIRNSKKKKKKSPPTEEFPTIIADVQDTNEKHEERNHLKSDLPQKVLVSENDSSSSSSECKSDTSNSIEIDGRSNNIVKSTANAERVDQLGVGGRHVELSDTAGESKKGPSRSTRRKKAKRRWLRENAQNEEQQQQQLFETSIDQGPSENDDVDMDVDTVPVVVKPGHIRFEPVGKVAADQAGQQKQNHFPKETFNWNGITSKKKGQKWGKEKTPSWKNNYDNCSGEGEPLQLPTSETEQPTTPAPVVGPINFDELRPCTGLPQKGDIVAYRLIELSDTWTPEISSFRAGKVSWYDTESNRIMLIPVPEYPLPVKKEIDEDSALPLDTTPYGEDGSLKIDFASLVDIRVIRQGNLDSSNQEITSAKQSAESSKLAHNNGDANDTKKGNGKVSAWDEISEVLSAKKAELSKNDGWNREGSSGRRSDGWNQEESPGRRSGSHRALRGSALGPVMALLRAQNEL